MNNVEKTKNYLVFRHADDQRKIKPDHVKKLRKSIKTNGFLESKPITVYEEEGKLVVIDGHHRLDAAIGLNVPVVYLVVKKSESNTMMDQNALMLKWSFTDYCVTWFRRGKADYGTLLAYAESIPIKIAACLLNNNNVSSDNVTAKIVNGTFKVKTTHVIDTLLDMSSKLPDARPVMSTRPFIAAFAKCMAVQGFSPVTLFSRIKENPLVLKKASNEHTMLDQVDELYNFRARVKIPLAHLAREASAQRSQTTLKK